MLGFAILWLFQGRLRPVLTSLLITLGVNLVELWLVGPGIFLDALKAVSVTQYYPLANVGAYGVTPYNFWMPILRQPAAIWISLITGGLFVLVMYRLKAEWTAFLLPFILFNHVLFYDLVVLLPVLILFSKESRNFALLTAILFLLIPVLVLVSSVTHTAWLGLLTFLIAGGIVIHQLEAQFSKKKALAA
jgi:hypothetical protein